VCNRAADSIIIGPDVGGGKKQSHTVARTPHHCVGIVGCLGVASPPEHQALAMTNLLGRRSTDEDRAHAQSNLAPLQRSSGWTDKGDHTFINSLRLIIVVFSLSRATRHLPQLHPMVQKKVERGSRPDRINSSAWFRMLDHAQLATELVIC
jgi:hypothetical protein